MSVVVPLSISSGSSSTAAASVSPTLFDSLH
jgi:hypothetical protein